MTSPESLNQILDAGPRPGVVFLPTLDLDDVPRVDAERDITPSTLKQAREATLAMRIMALANGPSGWGDRRYLILGARPTGELVGLAEGALSNDMVQRIAQRYCDPLVLCYYQEQRTRGQRVGMVVISDSPAKPFRFAEDVSYQQGGRAKPAYRRGEIWLQAADQAREATADEIVAIKLDAARVKAARGSSLVAAGDRADEAIDAAAWQPRRGLSLITDESPAIEMNPAVQEALARTILEQRVLVLCGPRQETCAIAEHLARQLGRELDNPVYRAASEATSSEFLSAVATRQRLVALACETAPREWRGALAELQRLAQRQDAFILLASGAPASAWRISPDLQPSLVDLATQSAYTQEALAKLAQAQIVPGIPSQALAGQSVEAVTAPLGSPEAIGRLAEITGRASLRSPAQLEDAVALAADPLRDAVEWFWALDYHQRYFVLAVCLLGNLPATTFWRYYEQLAAESWRTREPTLRALPGLDHLLRRHLQEDLSFRYPEAREAILAEALRRYTRPLVWALPNLRDIIVQLGENVLHADTAPTRAARQNVAEALGALALSDWEAVLPVLQRWATQRVPETRLVASRTLARAIAEGDAGFTERVLAVLDGWTNNVALEAGWAAPRQAYRVRWTAAWALGQAWRYLESEAARVAALAPLWTLARDTDPRVRQGVAQAIASLAPLGFQDLAGILGYLADDLSKPVRSHVAAAMGAYAAAAPQETPSILRGWADEPDTLRRWTAAASLLQSCNQGQPCDELLALAPQNPAGEDIVAEILTEVGETPGVAPEALAPLLERTAQQDHPAARSWTGAALQALAQSPEKRPAAQKLVEGWRSASDPALAAAAVEWDRLLKQAPFRPVRAPVQPATPLDTALEELETEQPAPAAAPLRIEERAKEPAAEPAVVQGPRRWLRQASLEAEKAQSRYRLLANIARGLLRAAAMAGMTYAVLRRFPYYDDQWLPVLVLAVLALGYAKPALGTALGAVIALLPLLYHAPALALGVVVFGAILFALSGSLGEEHLLEKRLAVLAFPMLVVTPWALLLPFLAGSLFRKRAAWVVVAGMLLAIVVGVALGQDAMGTYLVTGVAPTESLVLERAAPERWQSLGWLLDLDMFKMAGTGLLALARQLVDAFITTPLPLVQLALWGLVAWLAGWGASQPRVKTGGPLIALAALLMIACYSFVFPELLSWELPFGTGGIMNGRIVLGALAALLIAFGWPWARATLGQARTWEMLRRYLTDGKDWLVSALRK